MLNYQRVIDRHGVSEEIGSAIPKFTMGWISTIKIWVDCDIALLTLYKTPKKHRKSLKSRFSSRIYSWVINVVNQARFRL